MRVGGGRRGMEVNLVVLSVSIFSQATDILNNLEVVDFLRTGTEIPSAINWKL